MEVSSRRGPVAVERLRGRLRRHLEQGVGEVDHALGGGPVAAEGLLDDGGQRGGDDGVRGGRAGGSAVGQPQQQRLHPRELEEQVAGVEGAEARAPASAAERGSGVGGGARIASLAAVALDQVVYPLVDLELLVEVAGQSSNVAREVEPRLAHGGRVDPAVEREARRVLGRGAGGRSRRRRWRRCC